MTMQRIGLQIVEQFIDPRWLHSLPARSRARVNADGTVPLQGKLLHARGGTLAAGQEVVIHCARPGLYAVPAAEWDAEQARLTAVREQAARDTETALQAAAAEARRLNAALNVPVRWHPSVKVVLSGLTENSSCDGMNRSSVFHVRLLEPLADGKLIRREGSLLCTSASGDDGRFAELHQEHVFYENHRVTCRACLRLAARWAADERTGG